ncbi:ABC transporter substrate-binding protein [Sporosarcina sp. CAU 1771]
MKKINLFFVALIVLILAACSGEGGTKEKEIDQDSLDYVQGVTDTEIKVGLTGPQTGPVAEYDKARKGVQAYFNYVNENGGVQGRQLKLIPYDDQYQPAKTVQGMQRLIEEDEVFGIVYPIGTANISASFDLLKKSKIPVVGLGTGGSKFIDPPVHNIFGIQYNYANEAKVFIDYIVNQLGAKNIAIAYQNDDFGKESFSGAKSVIEQMDGITIAKEVTFLATDKDFSTQVQHLSEANADAILVLATPGPSAALRRGMHNIDEMDTPFLVGITAGQDKNQFNLAGEEAWEGVITAVPMADYEKTEYPDIDKYIDQITKDYSAEDLGGLTSIGWGAAQVFVEGLERVEGELTWESYIQALDTLDDWKGSIFDAVTYSAKNRYGNTTLRMVEAKDGDLVPIGGPTYYNPETGEISTK